MRRVRLRFAGKIVEGAIIDKYYERERVRGSTVWVESFFVYHIPLDQRGKVFLVIPLDPSDLKHFRPAQRRSEGVSGGAGRSRPGAEA